MEIDMFRVRYMDVGLDKGSNEMKQLFLAWPVGPPHAEQPAGHELINSNGQRCSRNVHVIYYMYTEVLNKKIYIIYTIYFIYAVQTCIHVSACIV